jgi:hypothetical protein
MRQAQEGQVREKDTLFSFGKIGSDELTAICGTEGATTKFLFSDRFCQNHCNSLNTRAIRLIVSAFDCPKYSKDDHVFKSAKISFFTLSGTCSSYFWGICGQNSYCMVLEDMRYCGEIFINVDGILKDNRTLCVSTAIIG